MNWTRFIVLDRDSSPRFPCVSSILKVKIKKSNSIIHTIQKIILAHKYLINARCESCNNMFAGAKSFEINGHNLAYFSSNNILLDKELLRQNDEVFDLKFVKSMFFVFID